MRPYDSDLQTLPRTVAVTGALGFVASRLLPWLERAHVRILAVVRPGRDASELERTRGVEIRHGELSDPATLERTFEGADAIVHLAGLALVPSLLPALERARVRRGAFVSSAGVYTRLASRGAEAKRAGEASLRASSLDFTILRPSMIYGTPRDRNLVRLLRWLDRCPVVPAPDRGRTLQQPVHVDDLVAAIVASLARDAAARSEYDLGGPEPLALSELVRTSARAMGRPAWLLPVPLRPAHAVAAAMQRWKLPFPVRAEQVLRLTESKAVDITPARRDLGFEPRPFEDGIREEVRLLREPRAAHAAG